MTDVTRILSGSEEGGPSAAEQLLPQANDEPRKLAAQKMREEKPGQTLQATARVHEASNRLVDVEKARHWESRGHFFAAAAEAMRRILVERARKHGRHEAIRGPRIPLDELASAISFPSDELLQLDEALQRLQSRNAVAAELVKLRFFGGLTVTEAAEALGLPLRSAERTWTYARSWLHRELEERAT